MGFNNQGKVVNAPAPNSGKATDANADVTPTAIEISNLDALQMLLDIIGLVPGFGAPADIINALISAGRGDLWRAGLSLFGVVPIAGEAATVAKIVKNSEKYLQALKVVETKVLPFLPPAARKKVQEALDAARKKLDELLKKDKPDAPAPKPAPAPPAPPAPPPGSKVKKRNCKPLQNGLPGNGYRGGRHGNVKKGGSTYTPPRESHHAPADATYTTLSSDNKPTFQMDKADHANTASHDNKPGAAAYRQTQRTLIAQGKAGYLSAMMMDVIDVESKFPGKYTSAIAQMMAWAKCMGYI